MVPPVLRGEATWSELRRYGIGWWVRSNDTLRRLIEKVTKKLLHYREGYKLILHRMTNLLLCVRFNMKLFRCAVQQKPEKACRVGNK